MAPFYIALSLLSNHTGNLKAGKLLHIEGRRMLGELTGSPIDDDTMTLEENGRPRFARGRGDFSISHSGAAAAVAWTTDTLFRTGCDIQYMKAGRSFGDIAEACFSSFEQDYIFSHKEDRMTRFYEIWVLKESYIKLRGLTIFDMPQVPSFIDGGNFSFTETKQPSSQKLPLCFYLYKLGDGSESYMLASALEGEGIPELRWFSQCSLPLKSMAAIKAAVSPEKTVIPNI
jgi:hypothetical protein